MAADFDELAAVCKKLLRRLKAKDRVITFYRVGSGVQPSESTLRELDATASAESEAVAILSRVPATLE